jgi:hypothetical protein
VSKSAAEMTVEELRAERDRILASIGMPYEQLEALGEGNRIGVNWAAWNDIAEIDYFIGAT